MKKKLPAAALAALLVFLSACGNPAVQSTPTPEATPPAEVTPTPEVTPEPTPAADDGTRYFFADGFFLGSWSDGVWRSCDTERFTIGEVFNRDYYDIWGNSFRSANFYIGMADNNPYGGFEGAELLEPFGIIDGDSFVMKLPGAFTGEAAQVAAPHYNFRATFDGNTDLFSCNVPLESSSMSWSAPLLSDEVATQALKEVGIHCDLSKMDRTPWACDMGSDDHEEYLELIKSPRDEDGYICVGPGEQCFYALILSDGEQVTVVASNAISYTDDLTAHFYASDVQVRDLDGDGICEVIFNVTGWEGGYYAAFSLIDDTWTQVLCSTYGT